MKTAHNMAEEAKVGVRNIRRDAISDLKAMEKDGDLSEDELGAQKPTFRSSPTIS